MGIFKTKRVNHKHDIALPANPENFRETPKYVDSELEIALPGGTRYLQLNLDFKIKGKRFKDPLDPEPPQFSNLPPAPPEYHQDAKQEKSNLDGTQDFSSNNPFRQIAPPLQEQLGKSSAPSNAITRPIAVYSKTDELLDGMLEVYPAVLESYNVSAEDWTRFLEDVTIIGKRIPNHRQGIAGLNLNGQSFNYQNYKYLMKKYGRMQYPFVKDLIAVWNKRFFEPRGLLMVFQVPEEIWNVRAEQEEDYKKPKKRSEWDALKIDQTKVIPQDKTRILIFPQ